MPRYIPTSEIEQQTDLWRFMRLGKFTGSTFHVFLGDSQQKVDALWEKIAERRWLDTDVEPFTTPYMERGRIREHEARRIYAALNEIQVTEIGLVEEDGEFDTWAVCSPDGLVGNEGIIEIKVLASKFFLQYTDPKSPKYGYIKPEYRTQIQFNLLITQRKWCDYVLYNEHGGVYIQRIYPDPDYQNKIREALRYGIKFIEERL